MMGFAMDIFVFLSKTKKQGFDLRDSVVRFRNCPSKLSEFESGLLSASQFIHEAVYIIAENKLEQFENKVTLYELFPTFGSDRDAGLFRTLCNRSKCNNFSRQLRVRPNRSGFRNKIRCFSDSFRESIFERGYLQSPNDPESRICRTEI